MAAQDLQEQLAEQLAQKQQSLAAAIADEKDQEQALRHVAYIASLLACHLVLRLPYYT